MTRSTTWIRSDADAAAAVVNATRFAKDQGFDASDSKLIATVVSELAMNIRKYADHGRIVLEPLDEGPRKGIRVTADDRGPGIEDTEAALEDHYSTGGSLGLGLPGVRRMTDTFDLSSRVGVGTTVRVEKWLNRDDAGQPKRGRRSMTDASGFRRHRSQQRSGRVSSAGGAAVEYAYIVRPHLSEIVSGDAALVKDRGDHLLLAVIDGLGHGRDAHRAAVSAHRHLKRHWTPDPSETLSGIHDALQGSPGAAAGVAVIELDTGVLRFAGVGNTVCRVEGEQSTRLSSVAGALGLRTRRIRTHSCQLGPDDVILMFSDGLTDRFGHAEYPGLRRDGPELIAETLVERFGKDHDDACCLVARWRTP